MTTDHVLPLLSRDVLSGPPEVVARRLLGTLVVTDDVAVRVVEVEAYGPDDPASHSARGRTAANRTMFAGPGHLYVYVSYGVHQLGNVVVGPDGTGAAVLLRAGEVVTGADVAAARRGDPDRRDDPRWLAGGPGRLGQVLGLTVEGDDGTDLLAGDARLSLRSDGTGVAAVASGPRVGVTGAPDVPWRFWDPASRAVSRYVRSPRAPAPEA